MYIVMSSNNIHIWRNNKKTVACSAHLACLFEQVLTCYWGVFLSFWKDAWSSKRRDIAFGSFVFWVLLVFSKDQKYPKRLCVILLMWHMRHLVTYTYVVLRYISPYPCDIPYIMPQTHVYYPYPLLPIKNPYPWHRYGFVMGMGMDWGPSTQGFTHVLH